MFSTARWIRIPCERVVPRQRIVKKNLPPHRLIADPSSPHGPPRQSRSHFPNPCRRNKERTKSSTSPSAADCALSIPTLGINQKKTPADSIPVDLGPRVLMALTLSEGLFFSKRSIRRSQIGEHHRPLVRLTGASGFIGSRLLKARNKVG